MTAVAILAILTSPTTPLSTIIIEQFRPPVDAYVIELPAGLIDPRETIESTAFRELEEETGYKADKVIEISNLMVCDPGTLILIQRQNKKYLNPVNRDVIGKHEARGAPRTPSRRRNWTGWKATFTEAETGGRRTHCTPRCRALQAQS